MTMLFIYGTLKRGGTAHHLLQHQQFLGNAVTVPRYRLVDLGPHPTLIEVEMDGLAVQGELWTVDDICLAKLEEYEDAPTYYCRKPVAIAKYVCEVESYFKVDPPPAGLPSGDRWPLAKSS